MYILKNAWISITRNKGRNILIGIIILVISCAITITLAIRNSSEALIESYESQYEVEATIGIDRSSMQQEMKRGGDDSDDDSNSDSSSKEDMKEIYSSISSLSIEDIESYADSNYVKSYYYTMSVGADSDDIDAASTDVFNDDDNDEDTDSDDSKTEFPGNMGGGKENFTNASNGDFTLAGYSSLDAMEDFISGTYSITDGEVVLEENKIMINSELASLNDLEVGDEITLTINDNEYTFEIAGIFEETESDTDNQMGMFASSANIIVTSVDTITAITDSDEDVSVTTTPTFILTSSDVVDSFESELYDKGMSEYLSVSTNLDQVESATSTISNVSSFATTFLIITFIIGGIVLFVINMINIRERKYEIGVLRTIGMKKSAVSLQFMCELLIVSIVALLVGAGIGASLSVNVSNYLLENEINSSSSQTEEVNKNFGMDKDSENSFDKVNGVTSVSAFDSIDAVVDFKVVMQLLGIGILLTLISSSCTMISIQKFSPLSILKERT